MDDHYLRKKIHFYADSVIYTTYVFIHTKNVLKKCFNVSKEGGSIYLYRI